MKDILYNDDQIASKILQNIPVILIVFDLFAFILGLIMTLICPCIYYYKCFKPKRYIIKDFQYYCFALTVIPLIISCLNHAPYIIMAYVSDSSYASSIFIYYLITLFVEFGIVQYVFRAYYLKQTVHNEKKNYLYCIFCRKHTWIRALIFIAIAMTLSMLVNGTMIAMFLFFYYIPISYVLSNAPSQAVLIYQSAIVLVGAYITYKTTFERDRHTNKHPKYYDYMNTVRQIKEDEIAYLEKKVTVCDHNDEEKFKKRIAHRQTELLLATLHEKVKLDDSINPAYTRYLHSQQNEAIEYLLTEIDNLKLPPTLDSGELPTTLECQKQNERKHLEDEIFYHLLNEMDQIWREPNKSEKCSAIEDQINRLPKGENKTKLTEMLNHLK